MRPARSSSRTCTLCGGTAELAAGPTEGVGARAVAAPAVADPVPAAASASAAASSPLERPPRFMPNQ